MSERAVRINENERRVLVFLAEGKYGFCDMMCFPFAPIMKQTWLDRKTVRRACRALARKGLAEYANALSTEDGEFAGAGYGCSDAGEKFIDSLKEPSP